MWNKYISRVYKFVLIWEAYDKSVIYVGHFIHITNMCDTSGIVWIHLFDWSIDRIECFSSLNIFVVFSCHFN